MIENEQDNDQEISVVLKKVPELEVDPKSPWKDDSLSREEYANRLTELISSLSQPYVMGIDAPYGGGKTYFIKRWQASIQNNDKDEYQTVYFNAWQTDFSNDPLTAFISSLQSQLREEIVGGEVVDSLKEIVKIAGPAILKHAAHHFLGEDATNALLEGGSKEAIDITHKIATKQFEDQKKAVNAIEEFEKELKKLISNLPSSKKKHSGPRLIVFVDELDRCRPNYATEILERIKHFFSVPGILFIISADREHLGNSFSAIYGAKLNQNRYLARFVDNWFKLPDPPYINFVESLVERFALVEDGFLTDDDQIYTSKDIFVNFWGACAQHFDYELRDQEQLFSLLNVVIRGTPRTCRSMTTLYPVFLFSMEKVSVDCENSCRTNRMHGKFAKEVRAIMGHTGNGETQNYYYDYISAAVTANQYASDENRESTLNSLRRKMRSRYGDIAPAQLIYEDIKYWNGITKS